MFSLVEMLRYMRPQYCETQELFCERFLEPIFGLPDRHGNYTHIVFGDDGKYPNICFTAHHDTVHKIGGMQNVLVIDDVVSVADRTVSSCLGADCTTGIWLMLNMIEAGVVGTYVVHDSEEIGCKGSSALVKDNPFWLESLDAVISFDRFGDKSIITHQSGRRTASEAFADSFALAVGMPQLQPDDGGSYTDSNEYINVVSECTNISVGYYNQHSSNETQDLRYANALCASLISADWSLLVFKRDKTIIEELWWGRGWEHDAFYGDSSNDQITRATEYEDDGCSFAVDDIEDVILFNTRAVAKLLRQYGYDADTLIDEIGAKDINLGAPSVNNYVNKVCSNA